MRMPRRIAGLVAGAGLAAGAVLAMGAPAQAYSPDPNTTAHYRNTSNCPCSISDVIDGTYFKYDPGGRAFKIDITRNGLYLGKLEFHPYGEQVWLYDNAKDGDSFYYQVRYRLPGQPETIESIRGGLSGGTHIEKSYPLPEGQSVTIFLYDDAAGHDYIGNWSGIA
ncbi:hypothetical protein SAMN05421678_11974 [Actinopolymorpha cephalotaxi]|uniref:Secreted protein n=1 Tax=Actinopolymorpha cephalotaxi TaxID=504797 RepID=A0A1I3AIT7_9ACTN|nr:hypothetical protein [Actinopolymorpha cephalotaxi]NYH82164.1 hypothetical protein [Actinopolymorpha cephalotaxi]SFH49649.1 hypothetical protein SAMN05421678_11974 [Actinopolymorpha cephalotaxi]